MSLTSPSFRIFYFFFSIKPCVSNSSRNLCCPLYFFLFSWSLLIQLLLQFSVPFFLQILYPNSSRNLCCRLFFSFLLVSFFRQTFCLKFFWILLLSNAILFIQLRSSIQLLLQFSVSFYLSNLVSQILLKSFVTYCSWFYQLTCFNSTISRIFFFYIKSSISNSSWMLCYLLYS